MLRRTRLSLLTVIYFGIVACSGNDSNSDHAQSAGGMSTVNVGQGGFTLNTTLSTGGLAQGTTSPGGSTSSLALGGTTSTSSNTSQPIEITGGKSSLGGTSSTGGKSNVGGTSSTGGKSNVGGTSSTGAGSIIGGTTASGSCTSPKAGTSKTNPIFTDQYTADPGAMVDNCTFYIACGHDEGSTGFVMKEWFVLKSTDMVTWTKTVAMKLSTFAWADANAWAGQMIKGKNGKYYWYVPVNERGGGMAIGVAVADSPEGPWKDALGKALINDAFEMANWNFAKDSDTPYTIDPTVFIDDDGQAYLQYGGFWRLVTMKLNTDMISINGKMVESTPSGYFESPYLIKRNNVYYEIYAADKNPATIDYATASSPMGPWTRKGTVLNALPQVAGQDPPTSHAAVAEFAGQWYIVYHVSNGPNGGGTYKREVVIDKLTFNTDGSIKLVTPSSAISF
jgi:hypothetical protein